jgi:hypothetical protein
MYSHNNGHLSSSISVSLKDLYEFLLSLAAGDDAGIDGGMWSVGGNVLLVGAEWQVAASSISHSSFTWV